MDKRESEEQEVAFVGCQYWVFRRIFINFITHIF